MAARRQLAKTMLDGLCQPRARQAGEGGEQPVEAELAPLLADEVQDQAAVLAWCQTQAPADLLLEQHRALRRAQ